MFVTFPNGHSLNMMVDIVWDNIERDVGYGTTRIKDECSRATAPQRDEHAARWRVVCPVLSI